MELDSEEPRMIQPIFARMTREVIALAQELAIETNLEFIEVISAMSAAASLSMMISKRTRDN